jgi:ATP-dependent protease Clp ATPase subunit
LAQQLMSESKTSPIAYYQSLWGMKDVQLKFTPEALEVIANQVINSAPSIPSIMIAARCQ